MTKSMQIPEALMNAVRAYSVLEPDGVQTDAVYRLLAIGLEVEAEPGPEGLPGAPENSAG